MPMKLARIIRLLDGQVLTNNIATEQEITIACGADLMSDVLAMIKPHAVLLTGLCNLQVVRTAQMADVAAIIFVRGKIPFPEVIDLANQENIPLISSPYGMFESCGRLYQAGLSGTFRRIAE